MRKKLTKGICLLICFLMCFTAMSSCKKKKGDSETTNATETGSNGEVTAFSTVRRKDYGGYNFNIMYFAGSDGLEKDFDATAMTGEVLNDKVYAKNLIVEDAYNIKVALRTMVADEMHTYIRNSSMAGESAYDVFGVNRNGMPLCYEGYFLDLTSLDDIDTTQEWWDKKWVEAMSIHGSLFSLVGDFSINSLQCLSCLCFNKTLFDERQLAYPYELVNNGQWTYERMLEYIKGATVDLNEDGKYTTDDFYGITGWGTEASYALFYASGISFAKTNDAGALEISYNSDMLTTVYGYVDRIWNGENNYRNDSGNSAQHSFAWDIFKANRSLFLDTTLLKIGLFLSNMENDYGVIPNPKLNEDQKDYSSYSSYTIPMTCVPINVSDPQRAGNLIEAFCTASYDKVTPDIFEIVTKLQNVNDADSAKMVDIVIRTKMFDPAHWYNVSGYGSFSRAMLKTRSTNISSFLRSYTKNAPKEIQEINDLYMEAKNKK